MNSISLEHISRIVGHIDLNVEVKDGKARASLEILNDPRFVEALVLGKRYYDVPEITSRICGPCSLSHTLTPIVALEKAVNVQVPEEIKMLRETAILCEIAENHVVHLYLLTLPDYLNCQDTIELAKKRLDLLKSAMALRSSAACVVRAIAGRVVHPNACIIGGFTKLPSEEKISVLISELKRARDYAVKTVDLFLELEYPNLALRDDLYAAIHSNDGYPVLGDSIIFSNDKVIQASRYHEAIKEEAVPYSTSKRITTEGRVFYVGARARVNIHWKKLSDDAREYAKSLGLPLTNPFGNIKAQAIEVLHCIDKAIENLEALKDAVSEKVLKLDALPRAIEGEGVGLKEAPRGILIHHYRVDRTGRICYANIITPTTINSGHIEYAAEKLVEKSLDSGVDVNEVKLNLERLVRAYDPCLGCATHLVRVNIRGYEP